MEHAAIMLGAAFVRKDKAPDPIILLPKCQSHPQAPTLTLQYMLYAVSLQAINLR